MLLTCASLIWRTGGSVSIPGEHDALLTVAVAHTDPEKLALARRIAEHNQTSLSEPDGAAAVFRDGTPQLIDPITDEMLVAGARDQEHVEALRTLGMRWQRSSETAARLMISLLSMPWR
jgi:hypothetical protein